MPETVEMDRLKERQMNIAIFCSGNGSNFQAIVDSAKRGEIPAKIALMVCDNPGAFALERARKEGIKEFSTSLDIFGVSPVIDIPPTQPVPIILEWIAVIWFIYFSLKGVNAKFKSLSPQIFGEGLQQFLETTPRVRNTPPHRSLPAAQTILLNSAESGLLVVRP